MRSAPAQEFPPPGPFEIKRNEMQQLSALDEKTLAKLNEQLHTSVRTQIVTFTNIEEKVQSFLLELRNEGVIRVQCRNRPAPLKLPRRWEYNDERAYQLDVFKTLDEKLADYTLANKSLETQERVLELEIAAEKQKKDLVVIKDVQLYLIKGIGLRENLRKLNILIIRNAPISLDQVNLRQQSARFRYEKYKVARTTQEYLALGGSKEDLENDLIKGFARVLDEDVVFRREVGRVDPGHPKTPQRKRAEALIKRSAPISVDQSKRRRNQAGIRYENYKSATTARQYFDLGGTVRDLMVDLDKGRVVVLDEAEAEMPPAAPPPAAPFSTSVAPTPAAPAAAPVLALLSAPAAAPAPTGLSAEEEEEGIALECVPRKRAKVNP